MLANKLDRLFERYRTRDDGHALARVFDLISTDLYRFALHLCRDGETAEDLIQATFLIAIERREAYVAQGKLFSWLAGILGNEFRRRQRRAGRELDASRLEQRIEPDVSDSVADTEAAQRVQMALAGVPEPYRGVLELNLNENLEAAAIAERLDRPRGTVRAQLSRGRELIRRMLPSGLAGLIVALFPRSSHAAVREVVLLEAGFTPTTGLVSVAALKFSSAAAVVVAAAGFGAVALSDEEADGLSEAGRAEVGRKHVNEAVVHRSVEPTILPQEESIVTARISTESSSGAWTWKLAHDVAETTRRRHEIVSYRTAAIPPGFSSRHLLARSATSYSHLLRAVEFGEPLPWTGENVVLPGLPVDRAALTFFDGIPWGHVSVLRTMSAAEDIRSGHAVFADSFTFTPGSMLDLSGPPVALLIGEHGIVRRPFEKSGKAWTLRELAPFPLDVEVTLKGGLSFIYTQQSARARLNVKSLSRSKKRPIEAGTGKRVPGLETAPLGDLERLSRGHVGTIELVEAESGLGVSDAEILLIADSISLSLSGDGRGRFQVPPVISSRGGASILVKAPGRLTQLIKLKALGKKSMKPVRVELVPEYSGTSRLLRHDGEPLAHARIRFRTTTFGEECLGGATDAAGRLFVVSRSTNRSGGGARALLLDGEVEGHVETASGRCGRMAPVRIRELLEGTVLRLAEERDDVRLRISDASGSPVAGAFVVVSGTGENDERLHAFATRTHKVDDDGVCSLGAFFGDVLTISVQAPGRLREVHTCRVPEDGDVDLVLDTVKDVTIQLVPNVDGIDLSRWTEVSLSCEGERRVWDSIAFDSSGKAHVGVSEQETFKVELNLHHGRRTDGNVLVPERSIYQGVVAGAELRIPVTVCRSVRMSVEMPSAEHRPSAAVVLVDGDRPADDIDAFEHRRTGMGGYWQIGYPLTVPLGSPSVTIAMPGYLPSRVRVSDGAENLRVALIEGVKISGVVEGALDRPILKATILEVEGTWFPGAWVEYLARLARLSSPIGADGAFAFEPLIPGRYRIESGEKSVVVDLTADRDDLVLRLD